MVRARFINDVTVIDVTSESEVKRVKLNVQEDHATLINRDMADQHPMSAITGLETALEGKQDTLTSGENIQIEDGVISATDTTYTAGTGISIEDNVISSTATSAEWGNIGGTLSNQTDLDNALNAKEDVISDLSNIRSGAALGATSLQPNDNITELNNNAGYITGISGTDVVNALGYTPYSASNPNGYTSNVGTVTSVNNTSPDSSGNVSISIPTVNSGVLTIQKNGSSVATFSANNSSNVTANITVPTNTSDLTNGAGFITGITSSDVTTALGYTPYNSSNPNGYTSNVGTVTSVNNVSPVNGNVTLNIPTDTSDLTNGAGYITGINSSDVTTALGYTPVETITTGSTNGTIAVDGTDVSVYGLGSAAYTASTAYATAAQGALADTALQPNDNVSSLVNDAGYITSSAIPTDYVTTNTDQDITGIKTFVGEKRIKFKQSASGNKLGFTLYDNNNKEAAAFEYRPNTINSYPLMYLGQYIGSGGVSYVSTPIYVGFRCYDNYNTASYNLVAPLAKDAKSSFSLNTSYKTFYLPLGITDGNTTVTTASTGLLDISSILPTVNDATLTITQGGVSKGTFTANASSDVTIDLDAGGGTTYTAGTGINITNNVISVASPTLTNTADAINSLVILGNETGGLFKYGITCIGYDSYVATTGTAVGYSCYAGNNGVALGVQASCQSSTYSIAIGFQAIVSGSIQYAIQLGQGTNSEANSFYVSTSASDNWKMLGSDGKIPSGRLPIATSVSSSSTNSETVGAKLFYDTCGDIETLINAL